MRASQTMSHKASRTVAFRVTPEEYDRIQMMADISGKSKQDYLRDRLLENDITVYPNIRVRSFLEKYLKELTDELRRLNNAENLSQESAEQIEELLRFTAQL